MQRLLFLFLMALTIPAYAQREAFFFNKLSAKTSQRIISLSPAATEILFALDLGTKTVGVTRYCDRPTKARAIAKIGGFIDPQLEPILMLKPDLIIASSIHLGNPIMNRLHEKHIPILIVYAESLAEIINAIDAVGLATKKREHATLVRNNFNQKIQGFRNKISKDTTALFVIDHRPLIVAGPNTFPEEIWALLGGKSLHSGKTPLWPTWSWEIVINKHPHFIIATGGPGQALALSKELKMFKAYSKSMPKIITGKAPIFQRPGIYLTEDIEALLKALNS